MLKKILVVLGVLMAGEGWRLHDNLTVTNRGIGRILNGDDSLAPCVHMAGFLAVDALATDLGERFCEEHRIPLTVQPCIASERHLLVNDGVLRQERRGGCQLLVRSL